MFGRTTCRTVAAVAAASTLLLGSISWAQPTRDHLQCFKIKDSLTRAAYKADLSPDNAVFPRLEPGCTIRTPARQLCIDVAKQNVQPPPPADVSGRQGQVYLCYKAVCNKLSTSLDVSDQFGDHALQVRATTVVCTPVAGPCANGIKDEDETDVDCGGSCSGCAGGAHCIVDGDCASGVCAPDGRCDAVCPAGFADCDGLLDTGCEADLSSDPNNCGACGISVSSGNQCLVDSCVEGEPVWSPAPAGTPCDQDGGDRCDGYGSCVAGCMDGQFTCNDGTCIDAAWQCDGYPDCDDGSDEAPYNPACGEGCPFGQFTCNDGTCIDAAWQCDGYPDCPDASDEAPFNPLCGGGCLPGQFTCFSGQCIDAAAECNGYPDCDDGSDESPYDPICEGMCWPDAFVCADGVCIPGVWQCDGIEDCADGSDEAPANPVCGGGCGPGSFTCDSGLCIESIQQCDGVADCPDGSDEAPINPACEGVCAPDEFTCSDGSCIPSLWECDGFVDCPDGSDEAPVNPVCGAQCAPDEFTCGDGSCIPYGWMCDGNVDCPDASDEAPINPVCSGPACPGGVLVGAACWYLGLDGDSCTGTCTLNGLDYHSATETYAGSSGTDQNCIDVLDALGVPDGPFGAAPSGVGVGCAYDLTYGIRGRDLTPTDPNAAAPGLMRACACALSPP